MIEKKISSRVEQLLFLLKQNDKLHLRDAAKFLQVSEMTIRRDLNNSAGKISLLGGYLVDNAKQNYENNYFIAEHQNRNVAEKCTLAS